MRTAYLQLALSMGFVGANVADRKIVNLDKYIHILI
jgi:hypothetical protein